MRHPGFPGMGAAFFFHAARIAVVVFFKSVRMSQSEPSYHLVMVAGGNQVRKQASVKVVYLVLQAARQQSVAFHSHSPSVHHG